MSNTELDYETLAANFPGAELEVCDVDVQRLRDDRSEIMAGDEVAFVAVAKFRTPPGFTATVNGVSIVAGEDLFFIGNDAELRSERFQIDEDGVIDWIRQSYAFTFTLNGATSSAFQPVGKTQVTPEAPSPVYGQPLVPVPKAARIALPWLTKLNTAAVKDDYVDVDVKVGTAPAPVPVPVTKRNALQFEVGGTFGDARMSEPVELSLEIDDLEKLTRRELRALARV